jgi:DNA-directed RNA polymerase subunit RPC12/RpoP
VSGRIAVHLDKGLGWTKPLVVAGCGACGTELARSTDQATAERAASRIRCPSCGTRTARRLPGTTSPATDLAVTRGPRRVPARPVPFGSATGRR